MKKLFIASLISLATLTAFSQQYAANVKFWPLLSGYNVLVDTNVTAGVTLGNTNVTYTERNGQIVFSLMYITNYSGSYSTSSVAPDAFKVAPVFANSRGDYSANAQLWIMLNNTNFIPIPSTNLQGQYFVSTVASTNSINGTGYQGWPLAPNNTVQGLYPATTNLYPQIDGASVTSIKVVVYKAPSAFLDGEQTGPGGLTIYPPNAPVMWDATNTFTFTTSAQGVVPVITGTNLPATFIQGARYLCVKLTATAATGSSRYVLVNQVGISQPVP